jgi:translation elongation factor EF-Ts
MIERIVMAQITAAMVKELRETTGAGMMDCKARWPKRR